MVQSLDANIGRVLQALDINGLARDTIVSLPVTTAASVSR
jgi:arylsulfatase A-like enzyme